MSWPHQDDGTVDWDTVFDDPDTGLTAFVKSAKTTEALGRCVHVIIQNLFIRDGDPPYRDAFNKAVDELVAGDGEANDEHVREKILRLIQEIKANRVERVRYFLETPPGGEERRHVEDNPTAPLETLKES